MNEMNVIWEWLLPHATPVEGVFTLISIITAGFEIYALKDAIDDSAVLLAAGVNGLRRMAADNNIQQEQNRLTISGVMVLTSVIFLFIDPPPPDYWVLPQALIGLIAWIITSSLLMYSSLTDRSYRKKMQRYSPIEVTIQTVSLPAPTADGVGTDAEQIVKAASDARADAAADAASDIKIKGDAAGRRLYDRGVSDQRMAMRRESDKRGSDAQDRRDSADVTRNLADTNRDIADSRRDAADIKRDAADVARELVPAAASVPSPVVDTLERIDKNTADTARNTERIDQIVKDLKDKQ
jgi:hypothetical protein